MFRLKQYIKMLLQNVLLPLLYQLYCRKPIQKGSVLFADAHHEEIPFSMKRVFEAVNNQAEEKNLKVEVFVRDFSRLSFGSMVRYLTGFMKAYAQAEYVFICDYFLPVAACKKRQETKVVQLWHSCGLMKKIAYDTGQDIPKNYKGNMFGNYSYLTLSAPICIPVHERALRLPEDRIFATGVSRTDYYFDPAWNTRCRHQFYEQHPEAKGKKIALWAPTFRGNAAMPRLEGLTELKNAMEELKEDWYFIIKAHPHVDAHGQVSNCSIPTEELYPVADVLITDYSSTLFDYMIYKKPAVLFAPDLDQYDLERGFYLDYRKMPYQITRTGQELCTAIRTSAVWQQAHQAEIEAFTELYDGACDGGATERILKLIGINQPM